MRWGRGKEGGVGAGAGDGGHGDDVVMTVVLMVVVILIQFPDIPVDLFVVIFPR